METQRVVALVDKLKRLIPSLHEWETTMEELRRVSSFSVPTMESMTSGTEAWPAATKVARTVTPTKVTRQPPMATKAGGGSAVRESILAYLGSRASEKVGLEDILKNVVGAKDRKHVLSTLTNLKTSKHIRGVGRGYYKVMESR